MNCATYHVLIRAIVLTAAFAAAAIGWSAPPPAEAAAEQRQSSRHRDMAVIFISAHGARDPQLEYYLGTHEVLRDAIIAIGKSAEPEHDFVICHADPRSNRHTRRMGVRQFNLHGSAAGS